MTTDPKAPLRVLHATEVVKGGTATYVSTLVRRQLADPGVASVRVLATDAHREHLDVPDENVSVYEAGGRSAKAVRSLRAALKAELAGRPADVVHVHGSVTGGAVRLPPWPAKGRRPAVVYCAHGWSFLRDSAAWKRAACRAAERLLAGRCERIVCISGDERRAALDAGLPASKLRTVHNGLPPEPPAAEPVDLPPEAAAAVEAARGRGEPVYLFVGRYDDQKGLDRLLPLFAGGGVPGVALCVGEAIVGGRAVTFGPRAFDLGWATGGQVQWLLSRCDALLVPSRWEGFGLVAAEAMRAGRAVIAEDVGGLPEVVADGETGRIVNGREDWAAAWTAALREAGPDELRRWGDSGQRRFRERFTDSRMASGILGVYRQAADRRPA